MADEGNELALDRLADLADARGDLEELNELLDEGCERAGHLLSRRAVSAGDLRELAAAVGRRVRGGRRGAEAAPVHALIEHES